MLTITALYAALIAILFVVLSIRVIRQRNRANIFLGGASTTQAPQLLRAIRAHGNCAEYAPFALLLLALVDLQGAPPWGVHSLGLMLLAGRCAHAIGLSCTPQITPLRIGGMLLTFLMMTLCALGLIAHGLL